jgi:hypothetical protein
MAATPSTPNPQSAMLFFFIVTVIYCIISIFMGNSDQSQKITFKACYILLVVTGEYFINLNLSKSMCGINQWQSVFFVTIVPWLLIFITLNLFLVIFPGWLSPFSNTFGYLVVKLMGLPDLMRDIMEDEANDEPATKRAILSVANDDSLLINQFSPEEVTEQIENGVVKKKRKVFDKAWDNLQKSGILKKFTNDPDKSQKYHDRFYEYVEMKYTIAEFVWNMLTGFLVTSVTYNYIINIGCKKSPDAMKKLHDEYEQKEKQKFDTEVNNRANQPDYEQS